MFNLDNIGLETAFNIVRILGFLLICALGGVAWLVYFLVQEQKKPMTMPLAHQTIKDNLYNKLTLDMITREARRVVNFENFMIPPVEIVNALLQAEIAIRWANPDYEVVGKARRMPFSQQKLDEDHGEALRMVAAGGSLTAPDKTTRHFKLRRPVPQVNVDIAHVEAFKMIRCGKYD